MYRTPLALSHAVARCRGGLQAVTAAGNVTRSDDDD
jgi:hypothetical protein